MSHWTEAINTRAVARRLSSWQNAEDAIQDVIVKVLTQNIPQPDNPTEWTATAAWRRARDISRRDGRYVGPDALILMIAPEPDTTADRQWAAVSAALTPREREALDKSDARSRQIRSRATRRLAAMVRRGELTA